MSARNAALRYVRAGSHIEAMALELSLSDALGDSGTVGEFLETCGLSVGAVLPKHATLVEMITEMPPAVRLAWRSKLVGGAQ